MERDVTTEDLRTGSVVKRWDISGIQNGLVDDNGNETILGRYLRTVEDKLQANWTMDNDIGMYIEKCIMCMRELAGTGL